MSLAPDTKICAASLAQFQFLNSLGYTRQKENSYQLIETEKFALIRNGTNKYVKQGHIYYLDNQTPHQIKSEPKTSTLLLIDVPSKLMSSEIFLSETDHPQMEFKLRDLTHEEIKKHVKEFLSTLFQETA